MPFTLHPFAAIRDGIYIERFQDDDVPIGDGTVVIPVIADEDPPLASDERLWGPNYEVLETHVRAYGTPVRREPHEIVRMTFAQLLIGLVAEAWITEAEGEAWLTGTLPAPVLALIDTLPQGARFPAKVRAFSPSEVIRHDPLVEMLGAAQGKTPEELDTFFATYSQV
jgi:hypothetical protein